IGSGTCAAVSKVFHLNIGSKPTYFPTGKNPLVAQLENTTPQINAGITPKKYFFIFIYYQILNGSEISSNATRSKSTIFIVILTYRCSISSPSPTGAPASSHIASIYKYGKITRGLKTIP